MQSFIKFFGIILFFLSGCAQLETPQTGNVSAESLPTTGDMLAAQKSQNIDPVYSTIDAQTMYQIMVAEMLVQKKREAEAFGLIMPLAVETRDPGLAKRAFELSMRTYNVVAIKEASNLLKEISPEDPLAWKASYMLSVAEGNIDLAVSEWQKYYQLSKLPFEPAFLNATNSVVQSGAQPHGLAFLMALQKQYPDERAANYGVGTTALTYKKYDIAQTNLLEAAEAYQSDKNDEVFRDINLKLTNVYIGLGKPLEGIEVLEDFMEENSSDLRFQEHYARLEVKAGLLKEAEARYESILKMSPSTYSSRLSIALLQLERKAYAKADANLLTLVEHPQYQNYARYYLGLSKKDQNLKSQAEKYFEQVGQGTFYIESQIHLSEMRYEKVGLEKTIQTLKNLSPSNDEDAMKLFRAEAIYYRVAQKLDLAAAQYQKAIDLEPNNLDIRFAQSVVFYEAQRFDDYEAGLKKILELQPQQLDALNALGYYYIEQNRSLDTAEKLIDKALAIAPDAFYILDSKGWLKYMQGDYVSAKQYLQKALDVQIDEEVLIHLIKTEWALKDYQAAENLWQKYHSDFPENNDLQGLMQKLQPH